MVVPALYRFEKGIVLNVPLSSDDICDNVLRQKSSSNVIPDLTYTTEPNQQVKEKQ